MAMDLSKLKKRVADFQKRVANIAIGSTTMRGQGKGSSQTARDFVTILDLNKFSKISNPEQFNLLLDQFTNELKNKLPNHSWGAARKALNIFLIECCLNKYISAVYHLDKIFEFLEVPLDNPNAKRLRDEAKKQKIKLRWDNIKNLKQEDSTKLQELRLAMTVVDRKSQTPFAGKGIP